MIELFLSANMSVIMLSIGTGYASDLPIFQTWAKNLQTITVRLKTHRDLRLDIYHNVAVLEHATVTLMMR